MLWLVLAPGGRPFGPAQAEPILVDLLPLQDAPRAAKQESPKQEEPKSQEAKSEEAKSELQKPTPKSNPKNNPKNNSPTTDPKTDSKTAQEEMEDRAAAAARLAWLLNLPTDTAVSLVAPPSEGKSNLAGEEIAAFKAQVIKCWVTPDGVPRTPGFDVLIRVALKPDGRLVAPPELIRAPGSLAGPPLVASAKQALQQCQPYGTLPADKYQDWKVLDLTFTADGPSGLSAPPARKAAATH
ncbi:MAG TPA: hypothetical protein VIY51_08815 [Xanthobacteraceae bacterium]